MTGRVRYSHFAGMGKDEALLAIVGLVHVLIFQVHSTYMYMKGRWRSLYGEKQQEVSLRHTSRLVCVANWALLSKAVPPVKEG
jgi:hypothetical protein